MKSVKFLTVAALAFTCWSASALASYVTPPIVYSQTSDHCTNVCGTAVQNTVTLSDPVAGDGLLSALVTLGSGWFFQPATPGGGHEASFAFSSTQSNLTFPTISGGFTSFGPVSSLKNDGLTHPANAYGFLVDTKQTYSTLSFTIATTLNLATFAANLLAASGDVSNPLFSADVLSANGATGIIDFGYGTPPSAVPIPGALLLMGSMLVGGAGFAKFKRRRRSIVAPV